MNIKKKVLLFLTKVFPISISIGQHSTVEPIDGCVAVKKAKKKINRNFVLKQEHSAYTMVRVIRELETNEVDYVLRNNSTSAELKVSKADFKTYFIKEDEL